jgi:hypothetical protein
LKELIHQCEDNTAPAAPRYRIASLPDQQLFRSP